MPAGDVARLGAVPAAPISLRKAVLADWVLDQLNGRGIRRFALIGHDWGATVATLLAVKAPTAVTALVVEEEILPGIDVDIPAPGRDNYPSWHGPFNRAPGLAELLVPGREDAYYGTFLTQSSGPYGLDPAAVSSYLAAYARPGILEAGLGYYRTRDDDIDDVRAAAQHPVRAPVLAIGGRFAMGPAVAEGLRPLATDITSLVLERSGHYPVEQEPEQAFRAIIEFLRRPSKPRR
jgi:pimeloyl-ACP methyl ester carboxylesterase